MIYDILDNIEQYTGLFENLDKAIGFIAETDLENLPLGKTEIDGDDVFVLVSEAQTRASEDAFFETHSKYMDIHIDLTGTEIIETALGDIFTEKEYSEENDCALYSASLSSACVLGPERFLVCMVEEPHKTQIAAQDETPLKKCVFKVSVE